MVHDKVNLFSRPWSAAWHDAALGQAGFYRRTTGAPTRHFRTSVNVGALFTRALAEVVIGVDRDLGQPAALDLFDLGSGAGELVSGIAQHLPEALARRIRYTAVDVRPRPSDLDPRIGWTQAVLPAGLPERITGLVLAHELLDDVPLDVVVVDPHGVVRLAFVTTDGVEELGPALDDDAAWAQWGLNASQARDWLSAWWPVHEVGDRAEIGLPREALWRAIVSRLDAGTALAIDYGHTRAERQDGRWRHGSLVGYDGGRTVPPIPDGGCNLTAHVAVDALAYGVGADLVRQHVALATHGLDSRPPKITLAHEDSASYLVALSAAAQAAELLDPSGLGSFWWIRMDR